MSSISNNFPAFSPFPGVTGPSPLLQQPPTLNSELEAELECRSEANLSPVSARELNLPPDSVPSNPEAGAQVNQTQSQVADQITGGHPDKKKHSVASDVYNGVKYTTKVLTAPEKLQKAALKAGEYAEKGAKGELKFASKAAEKYLPKVGEKLGQWGQAGEKMLEKTPVVGKYVGKASEYAEKATGMLAGDVGAFKDAAKDLANKGEAFAKGMHEGGTLKHGVDALKHEVLGHTEAGKAVGKATEGAAAHGAEKAAATGTEHVAAHVAEKAAIEGAEHVGLHAGEKIAGKLVGKLIPGVNVAVSAYSAYSDGKQAVNEWKQGNKTGAVIDGLHTLTDAAGVVPGVGTAISIGGDVLAAGAHWLFGK